MKLMILTADSNGGYPVPAVRGGAVPTLIENLVVGNNEKHLCDMEIVSFFDKEAEKKAKQQYSNISFTWIRVPGFFKTLDEFVFNFVRVIKKDKKAISFRSPFSLLYYIYKAKKIVNKTDADKIIIENNIPLARVMKNSKFKGQWYYHFHNVPRIDAGCREEFKKVSKFLCVSQFVSNEIASEKSAIGMVDSNKTKVLLNCVDTHVFKKIDKNDKRIKAIKSQYGILENDNIIVFTGRLSKEKGVDVLLKAALNLPPNIKIIIIGSVFSNINIADDYQKELMLLANKLKERVIFTGYVEQYELPLYYNMADVAVLPSMWDEPAGLTMVEAAFCGIPVITTVSGGIPEYVGGYAVLLKRDNNIVKNIELAIMDILNSSVAWDNTKVREKLTSEYYIDKMCEILND